MDRPVGNLLLLWPTWWALWLAAEGFPSWHLWVVFTLGVLTMRAAGCAINDFADRELDHQVARTAQRPLASGQLAPWESLIVFGLLLGLAFVLVLFTNRLTIEMAWIGAALACIYPFTKRWTRLPQVVLGLAFGWAIPMVFAAVRGTVPPLAWLLLVANILWSVIYDTEYAMVDRDDDLKAGIRSTAILFASADVPILGALMLMLILVMVWIGQYAQLGWPYGIALLLGTGLFIQQIYLIRHRAPARCFAAFHQNKWWGMVIWLGIVLAFLTPTGHGI